MEKNETEDGKRLRTPEWKGRLYSFCYEYCCCLFLYGCCCLPLCFRTLPPNRGRCPDPRERNTGFWGMGSIFIVPMKLLWFIEKIRLYYSICSANGVVAWNIVANIETEHPRVCLQAKVRIQMINRRAEAITTTAEPESTSIYVRALLKAI